MQAAQAAALAATEAAAQTTVGPPDATVASKADASRDVDVDVDVDVAWAAIINWFRSNHGSGTTVKALFAQLDADSSGDVGE